MPNRLTTWLRVARLPFTQASVIPVLLGAAVAHREGHFSWLALVLSVLGCVSLHTGTNLVNEYYDHVSTTDDINTQRTPFSGGTASIQEGLISPAAVWWSGAVCLAVGGVIGVYFVVTVGWPLVWLALIGVLGGYFYTAPPVRLVYRGFGELAVLALLGPLAVVGGYLVQTGHFSWSVVAVALPVGLLVMLILFVNEFPDVDADGTVGKRHLVVRLGRRRSRYVYIASLTGVYGCLVWLLLAGLLPTAGWWLLATLPVAGAAIVVNWRHYDEYRRMIPAQALTILLHLTIGAGMSAVYFFG